MAAVMKDRDRATSWRHRGGSLSTDLDGEGHSARHRTALPSAIRTPSAARLSDSTWYRVRGTATVHAHHDAWGMPRDSKAVMMALAVTAVAGRQRMLKQRSWAAPGQFQETFYPGLAPQVLQGAPGAGNHEATQGRRCHFGHLGKAGPTRPGMTLQLGQRRRQSGMVNDWVGSLGQRGTSHIHQQFCCKISFFQVPGVPQQGKEDIEPPRGFRSWMDADLTRKATFRFGKHSDVQAEVPGKFNQLVAHTRRDPKKRPRSGLKDLVLTPEDARPLKNEIQFNLGMRMRPIHRAGGRRSYRPRQVCARISHDPHRTSSLEEMHSEDVRW